MISIEDIGTVVCACDAKDETILREVSVIGVPEMETFKACLKCKAQSGANVISFRMLF